MAIFDIVIALQKFEPLENIHPERGQMLVGLRLVERET